MHTPDNPAYEHLFQKISQDLGLTNIGVPNIDEYDELTTGPIRQRVTEFQRSARAAIQVVDNLFYEAIEFDLGQFKPIHRRITTNRVQEIYASYEYGVTVNPMFYPKFDLPLMKVAAENRMRYFQAMALYDEHPAKIVEYQAAKNVVDAITEVIESST